ncbi:dynein regulatory complex subunit 5-like [Adelges cooleyi]|uniref:dynein regulatory complex subunit 5-like n=1 Tax=Adelges cooleyi TaxID=133065 RepID=UPI00217FB9F6|nr:dynein regulatory complex subunit 5-like [Adelges cooleyi]
MWIPHTIPRTTFNLFTPSNDVLFLPNEIRRGIKSEDFNWTRRVPTELKYMCLNTIANNFRKFPKDLFQRITPMNTVYLTETLDTGLPLSAVTRVPDGEYWKRRCDDNWPDFSKTQPNVSSYKITFISEFVSKTIENLTPGYVDRAELAELLTAASPYMTVLSCSQLCIPGSLLHELDMAERDELPGEPVHVDIGFVLRHLTGLREVKLVYGAKSLNGVDYTPDQYKFNIEDMDVLGRGLITMNYLTSLAIVKSDLDVVKFNRLSLYLVNCPGLERADFSYCKMDSSATKSVANYAKVANNLRSINLFCNDISPDGVEALAYVALWRRRNNMIALGLNLGMNNINDIGAHYLASAIASGMQPFSELRIRNCRITCVGGLSIVHSLEYDQGLQTFQIDNNLVGPEVAVELHKLFRNNTNIKYLSAHNCEFPLKLEKFLERVAFCNLREKRSTLTYLDLEDLITPDYEPIINSEELDKNNEEYEIKSE